MTHHPVPEPAPPAGALPGLHLLLGGPPAKCSGEGVAPALQLKASLVSFLLRTLPGCMGLGSPHNAAVLSLGIL